MYPASTGSGFAGILGAGWAQSTYSRLHWLQERDTNDSSRHIGFAERDGGEKLGDSFTCSVDDKDCPRIA